MHTYARRARWLAAVLLLPVWLWAQQPRAGRAAGDPDGDDPIGREEWMQQGRTARGESPAALRYRAYQQKLDLRRARRLQAAAASAQGSRPTTAASLPGASVTEGTGPRWQNLGPSPIISSTSQSYGANAGRLTSVVVDQSDPSGNTVYIGAAYGGLYRSTNAANPDPTSVTWTPLIDDQPTLAVGAIAIKPDDNRVLLVGTGEAHNSGDSYYGLGILRSTDAGASWTLIGSADGGTRSFKGLAFSRIAFSTENPNLAVASTAAAGRVLGAENTSTTSRGLYYSTDAGATWRMVSLSDGSTSLLNNSTHSVVYHPVQKKFYAVVRAHGVYSSADGQNWTKLAAQPGSINASTCPPSTNLTTCPIYRGELAVRPGADEMYVWFADSTSPTPVDGGIYRTTDGGASWTAVHLPNSSDGISSCGDNSGCGTQQGTYNLYLAAVPRPNGVTDLYAGAVNIFKCTIDPVNNPTCASGWMNTTHVYGCNPIANPAHVHPDQQSIDFAAGNPDIVFFGNDGGVYRSVKATNIASGSCSAKNPYENLNANLPSVTQFVSISHHPTDDAIVLGGTQDNGSPALFSGFAQNVNGVTWNQVNGGDGGFNEINARAPNEWFTANTRVSIQVCVVGSGCTDPQFSLIVRPNTVGGDTAAFYMPYLLDPNDSTQLIVGTCRVWRVGTSGTGPTALSGALAGSTTPCTSTSDPGLIRALGAGGPNQGGSQVIYAATASGRLFVTTNAAGGASTWSEVSGSVNPRGYLISSIWVEPTDATGKTAYVTIMGFGTGHVYKTTDAGQSWTRLDVSGLPDAPADSVITDPLNPSIVYVGTDVGLFYTTDGANWSEYGTGLPNVPVSRLRVFSNPATGKHLLRASTYGRGVWQVTLAGATNPNAGSLSFSPPFLTFENQVVGTSSANKTVTLSASLAPVAISTVTLNSSQFAITANNCAGATLAVGQTCTITVSFSPTSPANPQTGSITVASNGMGSPQAVAVSGNAITATTGRVTPENGLWWDPKLNGIGFALEYNPASNNGQGGIFLTAFLFDDFGNPTWRVATGEMSGSTFNGNLLLVRGGQTLTGEYQPPASPVTEGAISITFIDSTHATFRRPDGSSINIERFFFYGPGESPAPQAGTPEMPLWWRGQDFSGTGYAMEFQGSSFAAVAYFYDIAGNPIWYLTMGAMTNPATYSGMWRVYSGGPTLLSAECPPGGATVPACTGASPAGDISPVTFQFSSPALGTISLGNSMIPIERFRAF